MNLKKIFSFTTILLITIFSGFSQYGNVNGRQANANFEASLATNSILRGRNILQDVINKGKDNKLSINEIEGEPYFDMNYSKGTLMYKDSLKLGEYLMRYNAYADEIEISNSDGNGVINKADYVRVILNSEKYRPVNYLDNSGEVKKGYFIILTEGSKASFFLRKNKTIKQAQEAKTSFHKAIPAKFIEHTDYFIKIGNNPPQEIKLKKNKLIKVFPDNNFILKKYAETNNLNLETEEDIKVLVDHYNSLK
ncbi:hypothetical protein ACOCEA_00965 [Maribacter sp. CXY002]|uniref:hypothetical protein n=1 Tax=Maribacter luteocoastalis TaxID=3407671 RepID=UPI003B66C555